MNDINLAPGIIYALEARGLAEADAFKVKQASMAKRRVTHDRTPHRIADPNHALCAATA